MQVSSRWRTATLMAGALLIGSVIGPPLVQAATAGLVRIEGAGSSNEAKVGSSGRLSVDAGLATTKAGQVQVAEADPASTVVVLGSLTAGSPCSAIYTIPAGKALIITGVDFTEEASSSGPHGLFLFAGLPANPCNRVVAEAAATEAFTSQNQVFVPGIAVPAGSAIGLEGPNDVGTALLYGYLVPAAAVPASALRNLPAGPAGGLLHRARPRH
jgi:hypothetical protein